MASELCRYGVLACGRIMHLDCRALYEAYKRGRQAPHRIPECSICNARFLGGLYAFVCDPLVPLRAKIIWCRVVWEVIDV